MAVTASYLNFKYKPILTEEIKTLVYKSTDSLYTISFNNVTTNIITGNASLKNVKITADTNRYKQLIALKRAPNNLYTISLKKLLIKRFHPLSFLKDNKLNIDFLILDQPEVLMANKQFDFNENRPPQPIKSPYNFISSTLSEFRIKTIEFKDASFKYINNNLAKPNIFAVEKLNIILHDLLIDSTSAKDPTRLYLLKDIDLSLKDYNYTTPNKLYSIKLNELGFKASTGELKVKKLGLVPAFGEMEFGKAVGHNVDRFSILMNNIYFEGIDLPLYIKKQNLVAQQMSISNGTISVFNDNTRPKAIKEKQINNFPHQLLQKISLPVEIKKIFLKKINIAYAAYGKKNKQKGEITFEHTSGTITNFTNIATAKAKDSIMKANLVTYLMGQGKLDLNFSFNLTSKTGAFSYAGSLHNANARIINRITKPLGLVQINKGNVDQLTFNFNADDSMAKGKLDFRYYDLSIALMRNNEEQGRLVKRGFMSFLANAMMINSENPTATGKFVSADVVYDRPNNTTFFNLIWRSLLQGIKYSIGITEEKRNEMDSHIAKFKAMRTSREERKMNREERKRQHEKERIEKEK